jgi:hypothetical protein
MDLQHNHHLCLVLVTDRGLSVMHQMQADLANLWCISSLHLRKSVVSLSQAKPPKPVPVSIPHTLVTTATAGHGYGSRPGAGSTDMELDGNEAAASGGSADAVAVGAASSLDPSGLMMDSSGAHDLVLSPTTGAAAALAQMSGSSNNGATQPSATIVRRHVQHRPPLLGGPSGVLKPTHSPAAPTGLEGAPLELAALLTQVTTSVLPLMQGTGVALSASPPTLSSRMSLNTAAAAGSPTNSQHMQQSQLHSRVGEVLAAAQGAGSRSPERQQGADVQQPQPTSSRPSNKRASSFEEVEDVVASRSAHAPAGAEESDDMLGVAAVASLLGLKSGLAQAPGNQLPPSLLSTAVVAANSTTMEADGAVKVERAAPLSLPPLSTLTPANSLQGPGLESGSPMAGRAAARAWTVPTVAQQMQQARKRAALEAGSSGAGASAAQQGAGHAAIGLGGRSGSASGSGSGSHESHDSPQASVGPAAAAAAPRQVAGVTPTPRNSVSQAAAAGGDLSQLLMGLSGAYHTAPHPNPSALLQGLSSTGSLPSTPSGSLTLAPAPVIAARVVQTKPPGVAPALLLPPLTSHQGQGVSPSLTSANSRVAAAGVDLSQQASLSSALHTALMLGRADATMSEASAVGASEEGVKPAPVGSAGSSSPRVQLGVVQAVRRPRHHSSPAPQPGPPPPVLPPLGGAAPATGGPADPLQPLYAAVVLAASQALLAQEGGEQVRIAPPVITTAVQGFGETGTGSATTHALKTNSSTSSVTTRPVG